MLYYLPNHLALNYNSLMTACVMLIALGAIIDVCVDMVSEMAVMKESNPYITKKKTISFRYEERKRIHESKHQYGILCYRCMYDSDLGFV